MNTGGKYDSRAFKKSVGLNGVGTKAVNALSTAFKVSSIRSGQIKTAEFSKGELLSENLEESTGKQVPRCLLFQMLIFLRNYNSSEYVVQMLKNYVYLNPG